MDTINPGSAAIARANLRMLLRQDGDTVAFWWGAIVHEHDIPTNSLMALGFNIAAILLKPLDHSDSTHRRAAIVAELH